MPGGTVYVQTTSIARHPSPDVPNIPITEVHAHGPLVSGGEVRCSQIRLRPHELVRLGVKASDFGTCSICGAESEPVSVYLGEAG